MGREKSRYGVIDVGSNTIHLLVGEVEGGAVVPVSGEKVSARLGAGVEKTGRIRSRRLEVGVSAIEMFARISELNGAPEPAVLATSAVRDAENGPELAGRVRESTGLGVRLISGEEEALLGFRGALSAGSWAGVSLHGPTLVVDLGGGSAQIILGDASGGPVDRVSLPLGTNRTTERYVGHDPPAPGELDALREGVLETLGNLESLENLENPGALDDSASGASGESPIIVVGGSARAIAKVTKVTQEALTRDGLRSLAREMSGVSSGVLAREQGLAPERARVLPAAAETLAAVLERFGRDRLVVMRGGIREGAILTMAERSGGRVGGAEGSGEPVEEVR